MARDSGTLRRGQSRSETLAGTEGTGHSQGARQGWGHWEGWGNAEEPPTDRHQPQLRPW